MEYDSLLFAGAQASALNKFNRIEREALRIITGATISTSNAKLLIEYGKASLHKRRNANALIMLYKIHNSKAPTYLIDILNKYKHNNRYNTRAKLSYRPPYCRLSNFSRSFFPYTIKLWNNLSMDIRSSPSVSSFKQELIPKKQQNNPLLLWFKMVKHPPRKVTYELQQSEF
jgi:hypothetical protein